MLELTVESLRQRCIESYADFTYLMQGPDWFDPIHRELCNWVQYHVDSPTDDLKIVKLNVVMPRGSLKTTIITKYFPIWMTLRDCNFRSLITMNTHPQARSKLNDIRSLIEGNETFRALFPELLPTARCRWNSDFAEINRTGSLPDATFESAGTKTQKTGSHYNLIIEDDTTAPEESDMKDSQVIAPSQEVIQRGIGWHVQATPLLVPKGRRIRLVVTTRWGDDDLVSYIRKNENYAFFDVPAQSATGQPIFTKFYSKEVLADIAANLGPYMFSCLYLNTPLDASVRTFKKDWFQYCREDSIPYEDSKTHQIYRTFQTLAIDPAISEKDDSCETAITQVKHVQVGNRQYQYWIKDIHGRLNPEEQVNQTLDLVNAETKAILVESNAYQDALRYYMRDEMIRRGMHVDIIPIHMRTNKNIRIEALVPYFANKRIFFCEGLTPQVESQLKQFPHGKLVDIIDCFASHIKLIKAERFGAGLRRKDQADANSAEEVIKELKKRYRERNGIDQKEEEEASAIPSGLVGMYGGI